MNTIPAQPNTYAVVGVDEVSPSIFVLPVIGWYCAPCWAESAVAEFDPIVVFSLGLEEVTKSAVMSGDARALKRKTQVGKFSIYIIDVVVGLPVPDEKNYIDRFKMILRNRKVK